ncbi:hypothetical protein BGZ93_002867, partial [Podila epicladia]
MEAWAPDEGSNTETTRSDKLTVFQNVDSSPLSNLATYTNESTGNICVLWSTIQEEFKNISHLVDQNKQRVFYEVDANYVLQLPLSVRHSQNGYRVVLKDRVALNPPDATQRLLLAIKSDVEEYKLLLDSFPSVSSGNRDHFLRALVASEYHYNTVLEKFTMISGSNRSVQNRMLSLKREAIEVRQKILKIDRIRRLGSSMDLSSDRLEFCQPRLFLVLPTRLASSGDLLESEQTFRIYYMCEVAASLTAYPQFLHLSNHPGYDLRWPQEFMQRFGQYALTMLEMAKHGIENAHILPPLETFGILQSFNAAGAPSHRLQSHTIGPLVDQAILYLQELSGMQRRDNVWPSPLDSQQIKEYLVHPYEHDGAGGLCRCTSSSSRTRWLCQNHSNIAVVFSDYMQPPEGAKNAQLGSFTFTFQSLDHINALYGPFREQLLAPDVTVSLAQNVSSRQLGYIVMKASASGIKVLRLHGVGYDVHSLATLDERADLFHRLVISCPLQMLILSHYPRHYEEYVYLGRKEVHSHGVLLNNRLKSTVIDWLQLRSGLDQFRNQIELASQQNTALYMNVLTGILTHLDAVDIKGIDVFHGSTWQGRLGVTECEVHGLSEVVFPNKIFRPESIPFATLRRVIHRLEACADASQIFNLMDNHPSLQHVELLIIESEAFTELVTDIYHHWDSTQQLHLVLSEKAQRIGIRHIATFAIWNESSAHKAIVCEHWTGDYVIGRSWNVTLLEAVTRKYPTMLTSFTLDFSNITDKGLTMIQSVLHRSTLEHLHIRHLSLESGRQDTVGCVLRSIQWSTIKSLVLFGDNIDSWLRFWMDD